MLGRLVCATQHMVCIFRIAWRRLNRYRSIPLGGQCVPIRLRRRSRPKTVLVAHRGIETVTVVLEGVLRHEDTGGGEGLLVPGDVQWMTAGRGVIHIEDPLPGETVHSLQLWVNLPRARKMTEPRYQYLKAAAIPVRQKAGVQVRVFSGASAGRAGTGALAWLG